MSFRFSGLALLVASALAGSACVPKADPPPPPAPTPVPVRPPAPAPVPAPIAANWSDLPPTPGDWVYRQDARGSIALFGATGVDAEFTLRCDRATAQVFVSRRGSVPGGGAMTIRTTSTARALTMRPTGGTPPYMAAQLPARDPILDAMGFSRGRIAVAMPSLPQLILPSWAEILRVTEDCRA